MRKVKLLSVLLAVVMVLPMIAGLGMRVAADDPYESKLLLTYLSNPADRNTFESMKLSDLTHYADGAVLTEASRNQMKTLANKNIEYICIGDANMAHVNGVKLGVDGKTLKVLDPPKGWYSKYADVDYEEFGFAYYLIDFIGPMKRAWIDKINNMGGYVMDSYPLSNQTYLVRIDKDKAIDVRNLDFVRASCIHTPLFKTTLWPKDENSEHRIAVSLTIAGNLPYSELETMEGMLKGYGCKTFLQAKIDNFYGNSEEPARPEGMSDEEYQKMLDMFTEAREQEDGYYETVIDEEGTKVKDIAGLIKFRTIGSTHPTGMPEKDEDPFEAAFVRVVCPMSAIADIALLPWVINIDMFAEPEMQNDLANWQIGSHAAWSANEMTGIVTESTDPLPHDRLDHFGLHGESFLPTRSYLHTVSPSNNYDHYRQIVAVVGTGLDTGDVSDAYLISTQYTGNPVGDFAGRVVDHLAYVAPTGTATGNTNQDSRWRWPPNNTGAPTRRQRAQWVTISAYHPDTWTTGLIGSRGLPWMDWDGHETHVTGSGFGDGYWSIGHTPDNDWSVDGREPYDITNTATSPPLGSPGVPHVPPNLSDDTATAGNNVYQTAQGAQTWDYRGVAYRAGIVVQRVTANNFTIPYESGNGQVGNRQYYHWHYAGRPTYLGLFQNGGNPPYWYLRAQDAMFSIVNDAYVVGARIQVNAWVVPHRGRSAGWTTYPNSSGDKELTYDSAVYNANEYNFFCTQMDRFTWEQKDMLLVQAGTTNTRYAAPFIYDYEYYNYIDAGLPYGARAWRFGNGFYSSPWCYTSPPTHDWENNIPYPVATPAIGVYYPPIGDTSENRPEEFNYYYHQTTQSTQPPTMDAGTWPMGNADGKADFATSALSPATAKNVITVGASESYRGILGIQTAMPTDPTGSTLPIQWTNRGPWTYDNAYGGWFMLPPLAGDNTANSDSPYDQDVDGNNLDESDWWDTANYGGTFAPRPPLSVTTGYGQVAAFSGRGPTPDLDYSHGDPNPDSWEPAGRFKPDIVAPGTQIMSDASYLTLYEIGYYDPAGNNPSTPRVWTGNEFNGQRQVAGDNHEEGGPYLGRHPSTSSLTGGNIGQLYKHYALMEGTSCATGFVAGAATVTRQFYENRGLYTYPNPSSALIKSTLIHGARNLGGQPGYDAQAPGAGYSAWEWLAAKPNFSQGFGRLDIKKSLYPDAPSNMLYEDHSSGITTGEKHYYYYDVDDKSVPFEATMVYTDMPKLPNPQVALANDLDLIVIDPGGTEYHGNVYATDPHIDQHTNMYEPWGRVSRANPGGTEFDRRNNVERVVIPPNQVIEGRWTVTISGARVEQSSTNIPQLYAFNVTAGNLAASVAPAPEVPALSTTAIILVILGLLCVGAFFIIREKAISAV